MYGCIHTCHQILRWHISFTFINVYTSCLKQSANPWVFYQYFMILFFLYISLKLFILFTVSLDFLKLYPLRARRRARGCKGN